MPLPQVSVDIFKGFPDEESIVNYTLNQAYQDNVTVFASELVPLTPALLPLPPSSPSLQSLSITALPYHFTCHLCGFPSSPSPHLGPTSSLLQPLVLPPASRPTLP